MMAAQKKIEIIATENITEKLNKAKESLNNITNSTMPVKKEMRELQKLMTQMNLDGLSNTDVFTQVAQEAGKLKDAMNDASQAMNAYANDTFQFKAAAEGFQAITAAGTVATSAMALFGTENENVKNVLLKVQAAQGVLNGVTALANVLNKDSALMLKIKQIRMKANMATQQGLTTATVAGAAAEALSVNATKKSTIAQNAWNMAKAVSKALLGDFTGLILVGAAAFATYAMATSSSADKLDENADKLRENSEEFKTLKSAEESYVSNSASKFSTLMKSYDDLRDSWNKLKSAKEKNQFLKDNKTKIEELTTAVHDIDSAESFFKDKTGSVVKAFKLRAQAAAAAAVQIEMYKKAMEAEMNQTFNMRGAVVNKSQYDKLSDDLKKQLKVTKTETQYVAGTYHPGPDGGYTERKKVEVPVEWKVPEDASEALLEALRKQGWVSKSAHEAYKSAMEMADWAEEKSEALLNEAKKLLAEGKASSNETKTKGNTKDDKKDNDNYEKEKLALQEAYNNKVIDELSYREKLLSLERSHFDALVKSNKATKEDAEKFTTAKTSYEQLKIQLQYQKDIKDIQAQYNHGVLTQQEYLEKLVSIEKERYNANLKNGTATLDLAQAYNKAKNEAEEFGKTAKDKIEEQLQDIELKLEDPNLTLEYKLELVTKANELQKQLDDITNHDSLTIPVKAESKYIVKGSIEDKRQSTSNAHSMIEDVADDYELGLIDYKTAKKQIADINDQLVQMGAKPYYVEINSKFSKDLESFINKGLNFTDTINSIDGIVSSFDNLNNKIEDGANAWETFVAAISVVESILSGINTVMTITNMLTNLGTAAKIGNVAASESAAIASTQEAATETATIAPKTAETIANRTLEASILDLAAAQIFLAHAAIPFAGVAIAGGMIGSMMAVMAAQHAASMALQAYESGGIIQGKTTIGDYNLARVNGGEMILNSRQQSNLFHAIDQNRLGGNSQQVGQVEFILRGDKLVGLIKNHKKITGQSI